MPFTPTCLLTVILPLHSNDLQKQFVLIAPKPFGPTVKVLLEAIMPITPPVK